MSRFETDQMLGHWLNDLQAMELFQAQLEVEQRILASHLQKLQTLDLKDPALAIEYTKTRSIIEGIRMVQATRERHIDGRNQK